MEKYSLMFFFLFVILLQLSARGVVISGSIGTSNNRIGRYDTIPSESSVCSVNWSDNLYGHKLDRYVNTSIKDVKVNVVGEKDQITLSHFYQQIGDSAGTAWNVSSIGVLLFSKYISFGFSIDRGDLSGQAGKFWTKNMVHRFGMEIGQSYLSNDSSFFGVKFAKEKYFPSVSFKLGYCWVLTPRIKTCFKIQGISFGPQQAYTALSLSFTKRNSNSELSLAPYWSATEKSKFNLVMAGKFYVQQKQGYIKISGVTGYFPNDDSFINYNNLMRQRYLLTGEGLIKLHGVRPMFRPACGIDYSKGDDGRFHPNWFVKLGLFIPL